MKEGYPEHIKRMLTGLFRRMQRSRRMKELNLVDILKHQKNNWRIIMAAIHDLLAQIQDDALRERIEKEVNKLTKTKKFGLSWIM